MHTRLPRSLLAATLVLSTIVAVGGPISPPAAAAGTPDITLTATTRPAEALLGEEIEVELTIRNTTSDNGFNTTIRDVLPPDVDYVANSATPNPVQFPQPDGSTVLVWENLFDSLAGTTEVFTYRMLPDPDVYDVFAPLNTVTTSAEAYTNSDPRIIPRPDATGTIGNFTGNDTASATTTLIPFRIEKTEPSEESELLRGVHDHQTVFTLRIENNFRGPSENFGVVDYLPAGLEFLGCGTVDNSTAGTEEYSGSGRIPNFGAPLNGCAPTSVTTVQEDPPGSLPFGVYTRLEWTGLGDLAIGAVLELEYAAAIPLQENTFPGPANPTSNLDNNTGPLTTETPGEFGLVNEAAATGDYTSVVDLSQSDTFTDVDTEVVIVEDISIHKRSNTDTFVQGQNVVYTLFIETSEYATRADNVVVSDVLPPILDFNSATPTQATGPVDSGSGTLTLTWDVTDLTERSDTSTITIDTTVRETYRDSGTPGIPVSSRDEAINTTSLTGDATVTNGFDSTGPADGLGDESDHTITSGGPNIVKQVSEQQATLDCDEAGIVYTDGPEGDYRPGDHVCFLLTVNFPLNLDTVQPEVFDVLPEGFSLDTAAFGGNGWQLGPAHNAGAPTFEDLSPILRWQLPDVDSIGNVFQVVIQAVIDDPDAVSDADITANLMKFRYRNTAGEVFQERDDADVVIAEPVLDLTKGVIEVNGAGVTGAPADGVFVQEGDTVTYQVTVSNATSENTFDVSVRDVLPPGITCDDVDDATPPPTSISDGGECVAAGGYIQWDTDDGIDVPAAGSVDLTYDVIVPIGISAGASLINTAGVRQYDGDSNSGSPFTYVPENNIDDTLTPNTDRADDTSEIVTALPTIDKTRDTSINSGADGNNNGEATIGETISYTVAVDIPTGVTYYDAAVTDDIDAEKDLLAGTVTATLDGTALPSLGVTLTVDDAGNSWRVDFPDDYTRPATPDPQELIVTFDAVVLDVASNTRDTNTPNRADFDWDDAAGTSRNVSDSVGTRIVEPNIQVEKTEDLTPDLVAGGVAVNYAIEVTNPEANNNRTSTADDTVVVDTVPTQLIVLDAPGGNPVADGGTVGPDGGTWNATARTITWTIPTLQPTASVTLDYQAETVDPLVAGTTIRNVAVATTTSMPGDVSGERTASSPNAGPGSGYEDEDDAELTARGFPLVKLATPATATVGEEITYRLVFDIPTEVIGYDVTVIDQVPPGVIVESLTSVTCTQLGGGCTPDISTGDVDVIAPTTPGSGDDIAFFFGDLLTPASGDRGITITYVARIADVTAADDGSTLTNTARIYWNETDQITGTPPALPDTGDFDNTSNPATDDVDTIEPTLTIDKNVDLNGAPAPGDERRARPGDVLEYSLIVENTGTSPAHDVTVTDVATDDTWVFADGTNPTGVTNTDGDPVGGLAWTIDGPIDPGPSNTVTITYTLTVPPGYDSSNENPTGPEQTNVADIPSYFGVPESERNANPDRQYREYDDVDPDEVNIELDLASIGDFVWFDVNGDGVQDPGEPGIAGVDVIITYLGPDGVPGGGDDETFPVTTDADGNYLVEDLPGGNYTVDIDSDLTPQGLEPSYDLDDGTASPNESWTGALGEDEDQLDVDFGYTGSGSIGDLIWLDQNVNGVQDLGEDGLGGVDVTITWLGPDGVAGGGDDIEYTTTTDVDGNYLVENLPAGEYTVEVDTADLPADYRNVTDPDTPGAPDDRAALTLAPGASDLDQDFGYAGSGSIGDRVFLDVNKNGSQDAPDQGLTGVVVELEHYGPDGVPGGGDDSFFATVTGTDGQYLFDNLPGGNYVVTVIGGITIQIGDLTNSVDPDGPSPVGDSTAFVALPPGGDDLQQDFGYSAESVLGDKVWLDLDADGVLDPGEPGLPGVTVQADGPAGVSLTTVTNDDGDYIFPDIPDGDWTVTVVAATLPDGVAQTYDFDDGATSTPTTPNESQTTLDTSDLDQDFGYRGAGIIGDTVWLDLDGDGTVNGGETGLDGVTVTLEWSQPSGPPVSFTTTTDASGNYRFENLPDGDYTVTVDTTTLPDGLSPTFDADGTGTPDTSAVSLNDTAGRTNLDQDFGYNGGGSIGDTIWFDRDRDGVLDAGETGIGGVTVTLVWDSPTGPQTFTTTTAADGSYLFDNLPPGDYTVTVETGTLPTGLAPTFDADGGLDDTSALTLGDGEDDLDQDFGYAGTGSIGDTIFLDLDGDGAQDPGEPGIPGQTVQLTTTLNGVDVTYTTTTDATGDYTFDNLPPGDYTVTVIGGIVDSATNTADPGGTIGDSTNTITLGDGEDNDVQDFGYQGLNSIGDTIWYDVDADSIDDGAATEPRLAGVTVDVVWFGPDGAAGGGDDVALPTATTDAAGTYGAAGLPDGSYSVTVAGGLPTGLDNNTADPDGGGDGTSNVTDLGVGTSDPVEDLDQDFGYAGTGSIGDRIWLDLDGDGVQDPGEPGIPAAEVTLTWAGPDGTFGTADDLVYPTESTDSNGNYLVENLPAGEFRIDVAGAPAGLLPTADPDGGGDDTARVTLAAGASNLDQDFGYVGQVLPGQSTGVGDTIWLDVDGDGVQDPGEPGVPGVTVTVTSAGADGVVGTADDIVVTTETDADGQYLVEGLPSGPTRVAYDAADLPAGTVPNSDLDGGSLVETTVDLVQGEIRFDVDFGVVGDATITGTVWEDANDNGIIDSGERGIPGVEVDVTWAGPDGPVTTTVTTDADGNWSITDIPPGDWTTQVDLDTVPDGYVPTTPTDGSVTIPPGGTGDVENGFVPAGSIGDTVWIDPNRNGVRDLGEQGASGVVVILLDDTRTEVARTTTDGNGNYRFDDLPPGTYTVQVDIGTLPPGFIVTTDTADPVTNGESTVLLAPGQDRIDVDFGLGAPQIPATGAETAGIVTAAALLILLGTALLLGRRRRPAR